MSVGASLRSAARDFYGQSWRLLVLNSALSAFVLAVVVAGLWVPPLLLLLVLAGPFAAGLMHCAVTVAQTGELRLRDAVTGVAAPLAAWARARRRRARPRRRAAAFAVPFYAERGGLGWVLAVVALYLAAAFGILQLQLWPLAVTELDRPLTAVARDSLAGLLRRPARRERRSPWRCSPINLIGLAAALIPFLTLTVAYSFLAAAHFALPRPDPGGPTAWPA